MSTALGKRSTVAHRASRDSIANLLDLIFRTALEMENWPSLISGLISEVDQDITTKKLATQVDDSNSIANVGFLEQFSRAYAIVDQILTAKEAQKFLENLLDGFSFGISYWDDYGRLTWSNREFKNSSGIHAANDLGANLLLRCSNTQETRSAKSWTSSCKNEVKVRLFSIVNSGLDVPALFLPRQALAQHSLPVRGSGAIILLNHNSSLLRNETVMALGLSERETELASRIATGETLRESAAAMNITYETSRTYLKRIFEKTNLTSQSQLASRLIASPSLLLHPDGFKEMAYDARKIVNLTSGRDMEVFQLGPIKGRIVILLPGQACSMIDFLRDSGSVTSKLNEIGVNMIVPQWPGTYRSDPAGSDYAVSDYSSDVVEVVQSHDINEFSILSHSYGSSFALDMAFRFPKMIKRLVLASAYNSDWIAPTNSRFELLYFITNILAKKSPTMVEAIANLMWRSVSQDTSRFGAVLAASARTSADRDLLVDTDWISIEEEYSLLRSAQGFEGQVQKSLEWFKPRSFALEDISVPVEIFNCRDEGSTPIDGARELARRIQFSKLTELQSAGHYHIRNNWQWLAAVAANRVSSR